MLSLVTRRVFESPKCGKCVWRPGSARPDPLGELQRSPRPHSRVVLRGRGKREGKREGKGKEGRRQGRERKEEVKEGQGKGDGRGGKGIERRG